MSAATWFQNLLTYNVQVALVAGTGLLLPRILRLRTPRVLYSYWQSLLAVCLLLPLMQPWRHVGADRNIGAVSRIVLGADWSVTPPATLPVARLILLVLAGGLALRLIWLAMGLARLRRYRESSRRIELLPPGIQETSARLGVATQFCLSAEIHSPVTFGLRDPLILLPQRFTALDVELQAAIATHELLHIVRHDWAVNLVEECVLAAFWYHPAMWWLVGRIRLSREQVVDRKVVELTAARKSYLYALVEIAAGAGGLRSIMAPPFLNESQLAERIRALVKEEFMSKKRIAISLGFVVVLTVLAGIAIIHKFPLKGRGAGPLASNSFPAGTDVYTVGNGVSAPIPIDKPEPPYTQVARAAKLQGTVVLWSIIGPDGAVKDVSVVKPLDPGLDQNAVNTIKTWKFKPAVKDGKPVSCRVMVEVSFRMF